MSTRRRSRAVRAAGVEAPDVIDDPTIDGRRIALVTTRVDGPTPMPLNRDKSASYVEAGSAGVDEARPPIVRACPARRRGPFLSGTPIADLERDFPAWRRQSRPRSAIAPSAHGARSCTSASGGGAPVATSTSHEGQPSAGSARCAIAYARPATGVNCTSVSHSRPATSTPGWPTTRLPDAQKNRIRARMATG